MNYYVAPMEGLTDRVWRQAHQKWFGWAGAPAKYYAPFQIGRASCRERVYVLV